MFLKQKESFTFPSILLFTGCPNASYYEENCFTPCHQNCLDGRCDVVDGTCLGCIQGYTGLTCETGWNTNLKKYNSTENSTIYNIYVIFNNLIIL